MASFPDLRPNRRSAKAESTAAPRIRARLLLAVSTALLLTASLAVSELATLRGARAHDASVFLTRELGPPLDQPLVRTPARATPRLVKPALGGKLEIRDGGLKVTSGHASVSLRFGKARGAWRGHQHGVQRKLPFGSEAIVLGLNRVEQSLTVDQRQGTRTWRWRLDAAKLAPRLTADGTVRFADGKKDSGLRILPVVVFDKAGKGHHSARTALVPRTSRQDTLAAAATERRSTFRCRTSSIRSLWSPPARAAAAPTRRSTAATSVTVARPASVATGSLMLAQVTLRNNDAITAPAGWTTTGNLRTSGATLEQRIYYRIATAADTAGTTYQWSWTTSSDGAAAILAYSGTDATNPIDVAATDNAGSGTTATATGLTTTQTNDMLDAFYGAQGQSGPAVTATQDAAQGMTQEYTIASGSAPASRARATGADGTQASAAATGNKTATLSASTPWVAHLVALQPPLAVDGAGTLTTTTTNVSASQTGNTITFTYTAAAGGMNNGSLTLVVPSGWTAPSTTSNNAGYTTCEHGHGLCRCSDDHRLQPHAGRRRDDDDHVRRYERRRSRCHGNRNDRRADLAGTAEGTERGNAHEPWLLAEHHGQRRQRLGHPDDADLRGERLADRPHDHLHLHGGDGRASTTGRSRSSCRAAGPLRAPRATTPATRPPARAPFRSRARRSPSPRSRSPAARPSRSPTATRVAAGPVRRQRRRPALRRGRRSRSRLPAAPLRTSGPRRASPSMPPTARAR